MPLTQAEVDRLTAAVNGVAAQDQAATQRLPDALATFAANHPGLDLTALQAAVAALGPAHDFWVYSKLLALAAT